MSTRHLLNMTMGAFAMLLLAAIGIVFSTTGSQGSQNAQIDLAVRQQVLVQDLSRQATALSDAEERDAVVQARAELGQTIVQFDRNLTALLHGGSAVDANGQTIILDRTRNDMARIALEDGAHLWLETGMPLADLAAGEFSSYSAAGQKALNGLQNNNVELMQQMGTVANALRMGIHARSTVAGIARWAAAGLAVVLVGVGVFRRKVLADEYLAPPRRQQSGPAPAVVTNDTGSAAGAPLRRRPEMPASNGEVGTFDSPVNFDSVNASVDQMSVDMNTIAGSTEKMRLAIDSVGNALQGMLYSLNDMAADTAEGHKIVRSANNAASFTADTAGDLASSAREMSEVVARVTQLAQKTKQVAAQIDGEAVHTGKTGEAFTSVVAGEVQGLSQQTNQATQEIEETVANILFTARQYEEAIGQIIKNVSSINKVSQNLGELMLSPPARVEPGTPLPVAQALTPAAAAPVTEPVAPAPLAPTPPPEPEVQDDPVDVEPTPEQVADTTTSAIADALDAVDALDDDTAQNDGGSNGNVFLLGGRAKKPNALSNPKVDEDEFMIGEPAADVPAAEEPVAETPVVDEAAAESESDGGSNGNVFMLGGPKKKAPVPEPAPEVPAAEASPEPEAAPDPAPAPEEPVEPEAEAGGGANVFMLNKPKAAAPKEEAEPVAEAATPAVTESEPAFAGPNIYGLEIPADGAPAKPAAAPKPVAEKPETVPPGDDDPKDEGGANIFMLNKPK